MLIISTAGALVSTLYAYLRQKKCKPGEVRLRGRLYANPRKTVMADVAEAFVNDEKYFMRCGVPGFDGLQIIAIDKAMMAALPDGRAEPGGSLAKVMVYVEDTPSGPVCSLAPEEIRFKSNLQFIQNETAKVDLEAAAKAVGFWYEVRLVLFTIAWLGIYQAPHISLILSALAAVISWRNVIPLRYTSLADCGFVSSKKDPNKAPAAAKAKKDNGTPPGYENWTEERKYLYSLEQKMEGQRKAELAAAAELEEAPASGKEDQAMPVYLTLDEPEPQEEAKPAAAQETEADKAPEAEKDSFLSALGLDSDAPDDAPDKDEAPEDRMPDDGMPDDAMPDDEMPEGESDDPDNDMGEDTSELDAALEAEEAPEPDESASPKEAAHQPDTHGNQRRGRHGGRKRAGKKNVADLISDTLG